MATTILPKDPNSSQLKTLNQKISKHLRLVEELIGLSFKMFEELRKSHPDSSLLVDWRWKVHDIL
jgi:hypothetical protein